MFKLSLLFVHLSYQLIISTLKGRWNVDNSKKIWWILMQKYVEGLRIQLMVGLFNSAVSGFILFVSEEKAWVTVANQKSSKEI